MAEPVDWSNAYFPAAQPAFTGSDPGMSYYNALSGTPGATTASGAPAWSDKLTKALGDLSKGANAQQSGSGGGGGGSGVGGMASAQSPVGGGRGPSLDTLVQLLQQRYQALYPGGGSSKGLLGV